MVDSQPRFHREALNWFAALTQVAGVAPGDLVVHVVGGRSSPQLAYLAARGVAIRAIEPFDGRSPHCNKIAGALQLATEGCAGLAVLTDTDVAVTEDPRQIPVPDGAVASRPVDLPNPPLPVLRRILDAAGLAEPRTVALEWTPGESTLAGNANGGLYMVPGAVLEAVATAWAHWAGWLLERRSLLEQWGTHVDQVAMCMALAAEGIDTYELEPRWNFPLHIRAALDRADTSPAIIHYHQVTDRRGSLRRTAVPAVDERVDAVNGALRTARRAASWHRLPRWLRPGGPP